MGPDAAYTAYSHRPDLLRLGASMALAGQLATLPPQRQAKLSCVRDTCAPPAPPRKQTKGYFISIRGRHRRHIPSLSLTPPRRKRTLSLATLSPRESEGPVTPKSPPAWFTQRTPKATPIAYPMQSMSERWEVHW